MFRKRPFKAQLAKRVAALATGAPVASGCRAMPS